MGVLLPIAVEIGHRVTLNTRHTALEPVHVAFHAFVLALILRTDAPTVAGQAGVLDGSHLLESVAFKQATIGVSRPADVALPTRRMATGTVIVVSFSHLRIAEIGAPRFQDRFIALQAEVQAAACGFDHVGVTGTAHRLRQGARVAHHSDVGFLFGGYGTHPTVTHDTVGLIVKRSGRELLVTDEDLFPCLQRRQFACSALTRGGFGFDLLFLGQGLQRLLIGVAAEGFGLWGVRG
jgi:hypothetical protein